MVEGLEGLSSLAAGGWAAFFMVLGAMGIRWVAGMADRKRAGNEGEQIKVSEAEAIRAEYTSQLQVLRLEVSEYRHEVSQLQIDLAKATSTSLRRGDRLNMVFFILRLVMGELRRLDADSEILVQAETLLSLVEYESYDPNKSDALNAVENTEAAAGAAVEEVKKAESRKGRGK